MAEVGSMVVGTAGVGKLNPEWELSGQRIIPLAAFFVKTVGGLPAFCLAQLDFLLIPRLQYKTGKRERRVGNQPCMPRF